MSKPSIPEPFRAMNVLRRANELERLGRKICHLEVGQPRFPIPNILLNEIADRQQEFDLHGYSAAWGRPEFKQAIIDLYRRNFGISITQDHVAATTGSSAAFQMLFQWGACHGKKLALTNPGYPAYRNIARAVGLSTTQIELEEDAFSCGLGEVQEAYARQKFDMLLIANPSNPTGSFAHQEVMKQISDFCASRDIMLISDEIYGNLVHDGEPFSLADEGDHVVVVNSFSKSFGMPGWRIGWMIAAASLLDKLEPFAQNFHICPPTISQIAAELAVTYKEDFSGLTDHMTQNRHVMLEGLSRIPQISICPPSGAFYVYARLHNHPLAHDSAKFSHLILEESGVALTPGIDFDPMNGQRWFRMSYAGSFDDVSSGMELLAQWLHGASK